MKTVIFGADKLGVDFYFDIKVKEEVTAFIDNDVRKQDKEILGVRVYPAEKLLELDYERIYIASLYHYKDIERQILEMGICPDKIYFLPTQNFAYCQMIHKLYDFGEIYKKKQFDSIWADIKTRYKTVKLYKIRVDTIGEFITCFFIANNEPEEESVLRIFLPDVESSKRICNSFLVQFLGRKLHVIQEENVVFWGYILKNYRNEIDFTEYEKYVTRGGYPVSKKDINENEKLFCKNEIKEGETVLNNMGIRTPFVCFLARTGEYNKKTIGHDYEYDFRNMNFNDYKKAIKYLKQEKITAVKMGRMEELMEEIDNCIDYAGLYADDFRDIYLASQCEFMVVNTTGASYMAGIFSKPVLTVNAVGISFGNGGIQYTSKDIYIPKKYYDTKRNRLLTLHEMMEVELECMIFGKKYEERGIRFVDNTPEEILKAVQEMYGRLKGTWKDSEKDIENYERYMQIYHEIEIKSASNAENWIGAPMPQRIATVYLRDNLFLL